MINYDNELSVTPHDKIFHPDRAMEPLRLNPIALRMAKTLAAVSAIGSRTH